VATLPAWAPAVLLLVILAVADDLLVGSRLGTGLWNCRMALQPLIALPVLGLALAAGLAWLRRAAGGGPETAGDGTRPARDTGSEGAAWPAAAVPAARVLFALNAVVWIGLGIASLVRLGSAPAGMVGVGGVVVVLMFGNAAAMAWLALVLGGRRAVWYWAAVAVVAVNALLSVADDFGLLDLAVLLLDGALLTLLLAARTRFLPEQKRKTDGEAKADERRHSF
jgi:hypothetical protein